MDRSLLMPLVGRVRTLPAWLPLLAALLIAGSGLAGCGKADPDPGMRPGAGKGGGISGTLVDGFGRPVAAARVKAFPAESGAEAGDFPAMDSASVPESNFTDGEGRYVFDSLPDGEYNLVGMYGDAALMALIPEVSFPASKRGADLGRDTLMAPGMIRGKVETAGKGLRDVFCYLPGTSYLAISDDSGYFAISKVPRGRYMLRYTSAGFLTRSDSAVAVVSGRVTQVPVRGLEPEISGNPPAPSGLAAVYDTLWARIDLRWRPSQAPNVAGYLVYRDDGSGSVPALLNEVPVTDTVYSDDVVDLVREGIGSKVVYRIKTVDKEANPSLKFSPAVSVQAIHPLTIAGISSIRIEGDRMGEISIGDTVRLIAGYRNSRGGMKTLHWVYGQPGRPGDSTETKAISDSAGEDTLTWIGNRAGYHAFSAIAGDASGSFGYKDTVISVLVDPPEVSVGPDTTVSKGEQVNLRGRASDGFGFITRMEWSIDGSGFRDASADTSFLAPDSAGIAIICTFRATDDDGNAVAASMTVYVRPDPPIAGAANGNAQ